MLTTVSNGTYEFYERKSNPIILPSLSSSRCIYFFICVFKTSLRNRLHASKINDSFSWRERERERKKKEKGFFFPILEELIVRRIKRSLNWTRKLGKCFNSAVKNWRKTATTGKREWWKWKQKPRENEEMNLKELKWLMMFSNKKNWPILSRDDDDGHFAIFHVKSNKILRKKKLEKGRIGSIYFFSFSFTGSSRTRERFEVFDDVPHVSGGCVCVF